MKPKGGFAPTTQRDFQHSIYVLSERNDNPTLEGCYYPKVKIIPSEDVVYMSWKDKATGEVKTGNRLLRYVTGEISIFADEQSKMDIPKSRFGDIRFVDGFLIVDGRDKLKRQFLDLCNWNRANAEFRMDGKRELFFKDDRNSNSIEIIDLKKKIFDLQGKVFEATDLEIEAYCMTFDIPRYKAMNINERRTALLDMITYDPSRFEKEMNSNERKRKYWIMKAFEDNIFRLSDDRSRIEYTIGGIKTICEVPSINTDSIEFLTDLSLRSPEVNEVVEKTIKILRKPPIAANSTTVTTVTSNDTELELLYKEGLDNKVIYKAGAWTRFTDKELSNINLGRSMSEFCEILEEDNELALKIKLMISAQKELNKK